MKRAPLALVALALSLPAAAQQNRVSLSLSTFSTSKMHERMPGIPAESRFEGLRLLPVLGYHRLIGTNTGIGIELGYGKYRTESSYSESDWSAPGTRRVLETKSDATEYYVAPSLFTIITTKEQRLRFIPAVSLPVSITSDLGGGSTSQTIDERTGEVLTRSSSTSARLNALSIGLMVGGAAQYRLIGNMYGGFQIGTGFRYSTNRTSGDEVQILNIGTPQESRTVRTADYKVSGASFVFQPAIVVNYFF